LIYGSTTARSDIPLETGSHYAGICFKPGKSRHFINAPASELTNTNESAKELLKFDLLDSHEHIESDNVLLKLNNILEQHVKKHHPINSRIDNVIHNIELSNGMASIADSAAIFSKSIRHCERVFKETVGISAKLYSQIVRFRRATALISSTSLPLARIATDLGYSDQSHMSHEFRRFANISPASYAQNRVAFLQDQTCLHINNDCP
jgi:AraC-like DNA-binding protein